MATKRRTETGRGLTAKTFSGLNKKRMESKGSGASDRVILKEGEAHPVQFLTDPDEFIDFDRHVFQEDGNWYYVPCAGPDCPLDDDEDEKKRKKSYQFAALVYDLKERGVRRLLGPKTLATQIFYRYQRGPERFKKRVYDVTRMPTTPVSYMFEIAEEAPVKTSKLKHNIDLQESVDKDLQRYFGDDYEPTSRSSSLDDDEEYEDDDLWTKAELKELDAAELRAEAKKFGISTRGLSKREVIEAILDEQE